jgi:hypothetical protein
MNKMYFLQKGSNNKQYRISSFKNVLFTFSVLPSISLYLYYIEMCCSITRVKYCHYIYSLEDIGGWSRKIHVF